MFFSLDHEDSGLNRTPIVTLLLVGLCILIWAAMRYTSDLNGGQIAINNAVYFYNNYEEVTVPDDLEAIFEEKLANEDLETEREDFQEKANRFGQWFFMERFSGKPFPGAEGTNIETDQRAVQETNATKFDPTADPQDQPVESPQSSDWKNPIRDFNPLTDPWEDAYKYDPGAGQRDQHNQEDALTVSEYASRAEIEKKFDSLVERARSTETYWFRKWGVVGGLFNPVTSITHMFLHASFFHLFFNMLFLYLFGPPLEDRFGHIFAAGFFLLGGFFAANLQGILSPMDGPTIGASGVVSAVIGAYLLSHPKSKVYLSLFFVGTPIKLPAWVLMALFFLIALVFGNYMSGLSKTPYWVYVGGFFFGFMVMLVIRKTNLNDLFWPEIQEFSGNLVVDAYKLERNGDIKRAMDLIKDGLEVNQHDPDLLRMYWAMTKNHVPITEMLSNANRVIQYAIKYEPEFGYDCYCECLELEPAMRMSPVLLLKLSQALIVEDKKQQALEILTKVWAQLDNFASKLLLTLMEQAVATNAPFVDDVAAKLRSLPDFREEDQLAQLESLRENSTLVQAVRPSDQSLALEEPVALEALSKNTTLLRVMAAVPLQLTESGIVLHIAGKERSIPSTQIKHLAAGAIREPNAKPYLILDLVVDALAEALPQHRILRITSKEFNPLSLFPEAANPGEGFRQFVEFLLATSEAEPLPSRSATLGMPYAKFSSVASFEEIYFA